MIRGKRNPWRVPSEQDVALGANAMAEPPRHRSPVPMITDCVPQHRMASWL
jgi:hypothetical protein